MLENNFKNKEARHLEKFIIFYTFVVVFCVAVFWIFGQTFIVNNKADSASIRFVVDKNQSIIKISKQLSDDDIIGSQFVFLLYSVVSGNFSKFKPGVYSLSDVFNLKQIVKILTSGPKEKEITFYPGMTVSEMDRRLAENGFIEPGKLKSLSVDEFVDKYPFLKDAKSFEGYLMPDTYYFYLNYGVGIIADTMLDNFWKRNGELLSDVKDINNIVTIASLIEKEVRLKNDKVLVSSVIENRLKIGMPLQIDASVMYGACDGVFIDCNITRQDFKNDTPYNTYFIKGIPVTPISNPTRSSIEAAINPSKTSYLYYLSDSKTGDTFFSKTFDEHNDKRAVYLGM